MRILHLAPHPDDELIGAPATLLALMDAGHEVTNFAVSLGRPDDHKRRREEVTDACRRAGMELRLPAEAYAISGGDDLVAAENLLAAEVEALFDEGFDLVVSPSPHDRHHGHEVVARAARRACETHDSARLWLWGPWADLPLPTTVCLFDEATAARIEYALRAHVGELERNNYGALIRARARANMILGAERVFGFGAYALCGELAELTTEAIWDGQRWLLGTKRVLDPSAPFAGASDIDISWWLKAESVTMRLRQLLPRA